MLASLGELAGWTHMTAGAQPSPFERVESSESVRPPNLAAAGASPLSNYDTESFSGLENEYRRVNGQKRPSANREKVVAERGEPGRGTTRREAEDYSHRYEGSA